MKTKISKTRSQVVRALIQRAGAGAGAHGKSFKSERRAAKISLNREF